MSTDQSTFLDESSFHINLLLAEVVDTFVGSRKTEAGKTAAVIQRNRKKSFSKYVLEDV